MADLFLKIINMSISASWLVLAVLVLRFVLKKAPKWVNVLLWGIVAVRLICPFSIESTLSLIPSAETISPEIMMSPTPTIHTGVPALNSVVNPIITETFAPEPIASANPLQIWIPILSAIWFIGMVVFLLYTAVSYWRLQCKVGEAVILRDNIYQSENVGSPFVLGIIRPKIYLPYHMDDQDLEHVVAHEQAHIRRRDHWWKPLGFLLLTIHWFNPLMWVAYILLCRDIELACDEKVIKEMGNEQRADYSQALVSCSVNRRMIAACPLAFGEVGVKERVKSVLNYKKPAFWVIVASVIVCAVVAVCFLTNPAEDNAPGRREEGYYLLIGADGVQEIQVSLPGSSGGVVNADGSSFKKGEEVYLEKLQDVTDLRGVKITALGKNGMILYALSIPEGASDAEIVNIVGGDGWLLAPTGTEALLSDINPVYSIWERVETSTPTELLAYLCHTTIWNSRVEEEPQISTLGNFDITASFMQVPEDPEKFDVAMARRAILTMRLKPEEDFFVRWSYPDETGNLVHREFFPEETTPILSLSSHSSTFLPPDSAEDLEHLIQFLNLDEKLFLRYAAEGNEFDPTRLAQENAVWFTPEDIRDIEYMELVWHDGQRFAPLTGEGYDYITTRLSSAKKIGATGCPYHSVLYIHRSDGVVGKIMPAEDSCDVFQSDGKYYQFGDRANPPYYESSETFYNCFGTSVEELPHYQVATTGEPLTDEELSWFNETFYPIVYDKQGEPISVNPVSGFFSSYYDDVRNMDFEEFMRYFPEDGSFASDAEFEALKIVEAWPFDWVETRDDMPVPIHKYQARIVDMVLKENAGITTADLDTSDVAYLPEYDAFYNYTSDFGPGMFTCTRGEVDGDIVRLYEELETGTDMLTLRKVGNNYHIVAHQCIEGDNNAERVYGR